MGYGIVIIGLILLVPFVLFVVARKPSATSTHRGKQGRPLSYEEPVAEQPSPRDNAENPAGPPANRRN
jgi:hypothetical protein